MKKIWLAGGCFWGVEAYFALLTQQHLTVKVLIKAHSIERVCITQRRMIRKLSFILLKKCNNTILIPLWLKSNQWDAFSLRRTIIKDISKRHREDTAILI
ncbi:MAG: Peptide methionine sulfoxide reductase [Firmicutes bacterium]|nr:Peptide methionine sulfoxide reductase [Bacillota bacterium]